MEFRLKWMILYWFSHPFIHPTAISYMCEDIGIISRSQNSLHANGSSRASGAMEPKTSRLLDEKQYPSMVIGLEAHLPKL